MDTAGTNFSFVVLVIGVTSTVWHASWKAAEVRTPVPFWKVLKRSRSVCKKRQSALKMMPSAGLSPQPAAFALSSLEWLKKDRLRWICCMNTVWVNSIILSCKFFMITTFSVAGRLLQWMLKRCLYCGFTLHCSDKFIYNLQPFLCSKEHANSMLASFHEVSASPPTVVLKSLKDHYLVKFHQSRLHGCFQMLYSTWENQIWRIYRI